MLGKERTSNLDTQGVKKKKRGVAIAAATVFALAGCSSDADVVSKNLSKDADMFNVDRRIVFYNGITDKYIMTIEGRCSLGNNDSARSLSVTCKTGPDEYKKHFLGLSDNVTFFAEQIKPKSVNPYNYEVIFKPESVIPSVNLSKSQG